MHSQICLFAIPALFSPWSDSEDDDPFRDDEIMKKWELKSSSYEQEKKSTGLCT